jgi:hypothetical protein
MDRLLRSVASFFRLDDAGWERHANPWSVWTRIAIWPAFVLALWSIHWIGWWAALPLALIAIWAFVNPRAFPPPASTRTWASRGVLGERIYLARDEQPIPGHHRTAAQWLTGIGMSGTIVMLAGLIIASPSLFIAGAVTAFFAKMWFVDRMVWLFDDMAREHPTCAAWLR